MPEDLSPEEMASKLIHRLNRLQAMRDAGIKLLSRPRLGVDVFYRGCPEATIVKNV